jgi:hypothetical protein
MGTGGKSILFNQICVQQMRGLESGRAGTWIRQSLVDKGQTKNWSQNLNYSHLYIIGLSSNLVTATVTIEKRTSVLKFIWRVKALVWQSYCTLPGLGNPATHLPINI